MKTPTGISAPVSVGQRAFFTTFLYRKHPGALWVTDGTAAGTSRIQEFSGAVDPYNGPSELVGVKGSLFFIATDDSGFPAIWKSDGTRQGTAPVKEFTQFGHDYSGNLSNLMAFGDYLLFRAGDQIYRSDGTADGTVPLTLPGARPQDVLEFLQAGDSMYVVTGFASDDNLLWRIHGQSTTGVLVEDLKLTAIRDWASVGSDVYFTTGTSGTEQSPGDYRTGLIWKISGSSGQTSIVARMSGDYRQGPYALTAMGRSLFFVGSTAKTDYALWKIRDN